MDQGENRAPDEVVLMPKPLGTKPDSARRSPQEKKQLSDDKDRRNSHGQSDKAPRKIIPRHKRRVNRGNRHRDRQAFQGSTGIHRPDVDDMAEDRLHTRRRKRWRKYADETLREAVQRKLERRQRDSEP
jgi:hypothetical protein